jgi:hypothetical protein
MKAVYGIVVGFGEAVLFIAAAVALVAIAGRAL